MALILVTGATVFTWQPRGPVPASSCTAASRGCRCCSATWAARSGHARTTARGRSRRASTATDEDAFAAAQREFAEELGSTPPQSGYLELGEVRQANGKVVTAWAVEGDLDADAIVSNTFEVEWPPRSGRRQSFPEVDRAAWFDIDAARPKLVKGQSELLDRLVATLSGGER